MIAFWIGGAAAGLCILALPLWLMGVPGTDNAYAKGWKLGLLVLLLYPLAWLGIYATWRVLRSRLSLEQSGVWTWPMGITSLVLLLLASGVLFHAFKMMSRP